MPRKPRKSFSNRRFTKEEKAKTLCIKNGLIHEIVDKLNENLQLEQLVITSPKPDPECIRLFGEACDVIDDVIEAIFHLKNLRSLTLNDCGIEDFNMIAMRRLLEENEKLTYLNLTGNQIGHRGAGYIAQALKTNSSIKELKLVM